MRHFRMLLASGILAGGLVAGCNDELATAPTSGITPIPSTPTPTPHIPVQPPSVPTPPTGGGTPHPMAAVVRVGDNFFTSVHNGSSNPAVDTVAVGGTVSWLWYPTEFLAHSVQSLGSSSFISSEILEGGGQHYSFTFTSPGTYQYDCAVHGRMMTGTVVVLQVIQE